MYFDFVFLTKKKKKNGTRYLTFYLINCIVFFEDANCDTFQRSRDRGDLGLMAMRRVEVRRWCETGEARPVLELFEPFSVAVTSKMIVFKWGFLPKMCLELPTTSPDLNRIISFTHKTTANASGYRLMKRKPGVPWLKITRSVHSYRLVKHFYHIYKWPCYSIAPCILQFIWTVYIYI